MIDWTMHKPRQTTNKPTKIRKINVHVNHLLSPSCADNRPCERIEQRVPPNPLSKSGVSLAD